MENNQVLNNENLNETEENTQNVQDVKNNFEETKKEEKTFTQEDLDRIIAKKFKQWEKRKEEEKHQIEAAEKLKRMSEEDRQKEEMKKQLEEYKNMKAEMEREKMRNQTAKELASKNLSIDYVDFVMVENDADATSERLKTFEKRYKADIKREVDAQVKERLRGNVILSNNQQEIQENSAFLQGFRG